MKICSLRAIPHEYRFWDCPVYDFYPDIDFKRQGNEKTSKAFTLGLFQPTRLNQVNDPDFFENFSVYKAKYPWLFTIRKE